MLFISMKVCVYSILSGPVKGETTIFLNYFILVAVIDYKQGMISAITLLFPRIAQKM